jgi:hypothetical protein
LSDLPRWWVVVASWLPRIPDNQLLSTQLKRKVFH